MPQDASSAHSFASRKYSVVAHSVPIFTIFPFLLPSPSDSPHCQVGSQEQYVAIIHANEADLDDDATALSFEVSGGGIGTISSESCGYMCMGLG
jgi:hypothetical protein